MYNKRARKIKQTLDRGQRSVRLLITQEVKKIQDHARYLINIYMSVHVIVKHTQSENEKLPEIKLTICK